MVKRQTHNAALVGFILHGALKKPAARKAISNSLTKFTHSLENTQISSSGFCYYSLKRNIANKLHVAFCCAPNKICFAKQRDGNLRVLLILSQPGLRNERTRWNHLIKFKICLRNQPTILLLFLQLCFCTEFLHLLVQPRTEDAAAGIQAHYNPLVRRLLLLSTPRPSLDFDRL